VDSFACVERIDMDRFGDGAIKKTSCRKQQDGPEAEQRHMTRILAQGRRTSTGP
jgi:hypothetical protein